MSVIVVKVPARKVVVGQTRGPQGLPFLNPAYQAQTAWKIDPQNVTGLASDVNDGKTDTTPLLTDREMHRRIPFWDSLANLVTCTFLSRKNALDPALILEGLTVQGGQIVVEGALTPMSPPRTGTLSGYLPAHVAAKSIVSSTNATPIQVTVTAHGYQNGDHVRVSGHLVNTAANGMRTVSNVTANTFTLDGSVGNGIGGGTGTTFDNEGARVTDSIGASWAAYVTGQFIRLTSGVNAGSFAPILKNLGSGRARVGPFLTPGSDSFNYTFVTPAGTETYEVVQPIHVGLVQNRFSGTGPRSGFYSSVVYKYVAFNEGITPAAQTGVSIFENTAWTAWIGCVFGFGTTRMPAGFRLGCISVAGERFDNCPSDILIIGGAQLNAGGDITPEYLAEGGTALAISDQHFSQGEVLNYSQYGSYIFLQDTGRADNDLQDWWIGGGGTVLVIGAYWGHANSPFFEVDPFAWLMAHESPAANIMARSTTGIDFQIAGGNTAQGTRANSVDGAALLAAGPYNCTFDNFAAPYGTGWNGYLIDIESGAAFVTSNGLF